MIPRGVDRNVVAGGCAIGAALLAGSVVLAGDGPQLVVLRLALVPLITAAAFVLDEPAAAAVDAVPRNRLERTLRRAVAVVLPLAVWVAGIAALELRLPATPSFGLLVEGMGVLGTVVAMAAGLRWAGRTEPGEVAASVVGGTVLALQVFDLPTWWPVPLFPGDAGWVASTALWAGLTVVAAILVVVASVDPYRRPPAGTRQPHVPWLPWQHPVPEPGAAGPPSEGSSLSSSVSRR